MKIISRIFLSIVFLAVFGGMQAQDEYLYDFNDLEIGHLDGQNGWSTVVNSGGLVNEMDVAYIYSGTTSYDGTKAVFYAQSGPNFGRTASRSSHDDFPFDFTLGGTVEIEIDIHTGHWGTLFGFGYDANNNGYLMKAIETVVNIENNEGGFGFHIGKKDLSQIKRFFLPDGSTVKYTFPLENILGWHRYKLFLDLDANDGAGSITMFVSEMEGAFVVVPEISDLNMGMTPGTGTSTDPASWSKVFLHATGGHSGFDNLKIKQPDTGGKLYQYLTFNPLKNHLTTDGPFMVNASSNQGLDVQFEIGSGPATIADNIITLTGEAGTVSVVASQPGNNEVAAANDVAQTFEVIDPMSIIPEMEIRNAVDGEIVRMPELMAMTFVISTEIEHPDLLEIADVMFTIDGTSVDGFETNNGFFIGNWIPPSYGTYTLNSRITSSGGVTVSEEITFEIVAEAETLDFTIIEDFDFSSIHDIDTTIIFPSFVGTYAKVTAYIVYNCPCDEWDKLSGIEFRGANGEWMELFRYITPYGVACEDQIDITDFVSQLQGKIDLAIHFPKSVTSVTLRYEAGTPEYKYSWVDNLWLGKYDFGNYSNLQPVERHTLNFDDKIKKAHIRLLSSGHGWGNLNTGNAAEFYETSHNIRLNGNIEFEQHLWQDCNPNPTGCQPQNGTWYYDRAGWCPGSIPILYQYDITPWVNSSPLDLMYEFSPDYVDECHPSHPDCISGVTCSDCNSTYNPKIHVGGTLVTFSDELIQTPTTVKEYVQNQELAFSVKPNPTGGLFSLSTSIKTINQASRVQIVNFTGSVVKMFEWDGNDIQIDLSGYPNGMYFLKIQMEEHNEVIKLILQD